MIIETKKGRIRFQAMRRGYGEHSQVGQSVVTLDWNRRVRTRVEGHAVYEVECSSIDMARDLFDRTVATLRAQDDHPLAQAA